jgi:hypothetical protein
MKTKNPFYHLRSNKYVDRLIFIDILSALSSLYPLSDYQYIGLGSYMFEDFKLIHRQFGISKLTSLEYDETEYKRAQYNVPFKCITVENTSATDYISNLVLPDTGTIIWLDYTSPGELKNQFEDYSSIIQKMHDGDILKITLNANPSSLGEPDCDARDEMLHEFRKREIVSRLGDFAPDIQLIDTAKLFTKSYPYLLLECLERATYESFGPSNEKLFLPLLACIYDDGTQMLTLTGIVCKDRRSANKVKGLQDLKRKCEFSWIKADCICVPPLTIREMDSMNKLLPAKRRTAIENRFDFIFRKDKSALSSYLKHYQNYPNYHDVSF